MVLGGFTVRVHKKQRLAYCDGNGVFLLIGNCIDPFDEIVSEDEIIKKICMYSEKSIEDSIEYINKLTGSFLIARIYDGNKIEFLTDPAGMLYGCYGVIDSRFYMSSHAQLIADIIPLTKSAYIKRLEKYRFFYKYGLFFPGDLTQYNELKRSLQNHISFYDGKNISVKRFYPLKELVPTATKEEYSSLLSDVTDILHKTLKCISQKYKKPFISMTGGMDSKLTVACANGLYDKFGYYSYITMKGDRIDAEAARKISGHIGIDHKIYEVSENDGDFPDIELVRSILEHNNGGYRNNKNDVRKRAYLSDLRQSDSGFDVEVKSWVSEIARANYYKKFGLKKMPNKLTPGEMTSMYKLFIWQRRLAFQTKKIFSDFIDKTNFNSLPKGYDKSDMYLWEFRYSAWGGIVITSGHTYSNEIFIPYNNRLLLDKMLRAPLEKRISDEFHDDLIKKANCKINETGINVTN
ncbi:MAG: hypothetical protein IJS94_00465, partial [Clostridia bacterium]|nr:hypothetical protein [Clostridia bacterium]